MRRSIITTLAVATLLLAACGGSDDRADETPAPATSAASAEPPGTDAPPSDSTDAADIVPATLPSLGTLPPRPGQRDCTLDGTISGGASKTFSGATAGSYEGYSGGREYAALDGVDSIAVLVIDEVDTNATVTVNGLTYLSFGASGTIEGGLDGSAATIRATLTSPDGDPIDVDVRFTC